MISLNVDVGINIKYIINNFNLPVIGTSKKFFLHCKCKGIVIVLLKKKNLYQNLHFNIIN